MPKSLNRVTMLGHLGADAEVRHTPTGKTVASFSLATDRRRKDPNTGEWFNETEWSRIVYWNAENISNFLTKGKQVYIDGRLSTRTWEDKDGQKRYVTEVVAEELILCGGNAATGGQSTTTAEEWTRPIPITAGPTGQKIPIDPMEINDTDVPF